MKRCDKCEQYYFGEKCNCKKFVIIHEEYNGDEEVIYYGTDFENVAEKYGSKHNDDDPVVNDYIFSDPIKIIDENGITKLFKIYAEPEINYYPKEVGI